MLSHRPRPAAPKGSRRLLAVLVVAAASLAAAPPAAHAQWDSRWERAERERERARERAREQARLARERAARARERAARERYDDRYDDRVRIVSVERVEQRSARRFERPRASLGAGLDIRQFGDNTGRYLAQGAVDFRARSGLGVRPEVVYGWTERQGLAAGGGTQVAATRARSQLLGVLVSGTYAFARSSRARPYLLSGVGVFSSRTPSLDLTGGTPRVVYANNVDLGLNGGGGIEFDAGPVSLYTELRYALTDQPRALGFSGALPITVGLRF